MENQILYIPNIPKTVAKEEVSDTLKTLGFGIIKNLVLKEGVRENMAVLCFNNDVKIEEMEELPEPSCTNSLQISFTNVLNPWNLYKKFENIKTNDFPDTLFPNVTDNREQRKRNAVVDSSMEIFLPRKTPHKPHAESYEGDINSIRKSLFV